MYKIVWGVNIIMLIFIILLFIFGCDKPVDNHTNKEDHSGLYRIKIIEKDGSFYYTEVKRK